MSNNTNQRKNARNNLRKFTHTTHKKLADRSFFQALETFFTFRRVDVGVYEVKKVFVQDGFFSDGVAYEAIFGFSILIVNGCE